MRHRLFAPGTSPERLLGPAHVDQRRRPKRGIALPVHLFVGFLVTGQGQPKTAGLKVGVPGAP